MIVRAATAGDHDAIVRCVHAAYEPFVGPIGRTPAPMLDDYKALIEQRSVDVLEVDGALAGLIVMWPIEDHLFIDNIAVDPSHHGSGIGTQLLDHATGKADEFGLSELRLYTNVAMTQNLEYYPRRGFVETHRATDRGYQRVFFSRPV